MILEVVIFNIKAELVSQFEAVLSRAAALSANVPGRISHELQRCIETKGRYLYIIRWETIEAHMAYKQSPQSQQNRNLFGEFLAAPSIAQHFEPITDDRI